MTLILLVALTAFSPMVFGHIGMLMNFSYGVNKPKGPMNKPQDPMSNRNLSDFLYHGPEHRDDRPPDGNIAILQPGGKFMAQLCCLQSACDIATPGDDIRDPVKYPNDPCPGSPPIQRHWNGSKSNLGACCLSIAPKDDPNDVKLDDIIIFSCNDTCVDVRDTYFDVPEIMPACPEKGCTCGWHWTHNFAFEAYNNAFSCMVNPVTSTEPLGKSRPPVPCSDDPKKCRQGPKQPILINQAESINNVKLPDGRYDLGLYKEVMGFPPGPQDIYDTPPSTTTTISIGQPPNPTSTPPTCPTKDNLKAGANAHKRMPRRSLHGK